MSVTFRVLSANLERAEIAELLGLEPDEPPWSDRAGDRSDGSHTAAEGVWMLRSRLPEGAALNDHIRDVIGRISEKRLILQQLKWRRCRLDLFVGVFGLDGNAGLEVRAETLKELGDLGIDLDLDLYTS